MYYPNQIEAGDKIIDLFKDVTDYVLLIAQMQSGKTGVARYIVEKHFLDKPNNYYICGMNDNDLRQQIITDLNPIINKKNVLFSKQLQKVNNNEKLNIDLLIIDESHYASEIFSQIDIFVNKHKIKKILSISATPMAELSSIANVNKRIVILKPGEKYYGLQDLFDAKRIFQSINLSGELDEFYNIIQKEYENQKDNWKYNLVRIPNIFYYRDIEDYIGSDYDICYINQHSSYTIVNFNDIISKPAEKFTIIWIYGSLRAGKQLDTQNIGFVHDTYNSGTDVTAQSLLGRILGYNKKDHNVICYTDYASAERMLHWINTNFNIGYIPIKCRSIIGGCKYDVNNMSNWKLHVPIHVELLDRFIIPFMNLKIKHGNRYPYRDVLKRAILESVESDVFEKIKHIFDYYLYGKHGGLMVFGESNSYRSYKEHFLGNYNSYLKGKSVRGFIVDESQINDEDYRFYYIICNMRKDEFIGSCIIIYKEFICSYDEISPVETKLKNTSRFCE